MALLFCDGFDHYATADLTKKGWSPGTGGTIGASAGRRGGGALLVNGGSSMTKSFTPSQTAIVGFAFYVASGPTGLAFHIQDGSTTQIVVSVQSDLSLKVFRTSSAGTLLGQTAANVVGAGFTYLEIKTKIDPTAGTVELRINGASVLSLTGQNTRQTANSSVSNFMISAGSVPTFDDFYICDTTGTANNDFLGDIRVDTLLPNADGTYSQFTPNSGTVHYSKVADTAPDATTYNSGSAVGNKDTYQFTDLSPVTGTIKGIQVNVMALKDDAGARSIAPLLKSGSAEAQGTSTALSTSQTNTLAIYEGDPALQVGGMVDNSSYARILTASGTTLPALSMVQSKIGGASLDLNSASANASVSIPDAASLTLGSGAFTIELWAYWSSHGAGADETMLSQYATNNISWVLEYGAFAGFGFRMSSNGTAITTSVMYASQPTTATWTHIAVVRDASGVLTVYVNGISQATGNLGATALFDSSAPLLIGNIGDLSRKFPGYLDEIRISNVARYTGNFTAPATAFTADANTLLLCHMDSAATAPWTEATINALEAGTIITG